MKHLLTTGCSLLLLLVTALQPVVAQDKEPFSLPRLPYAYSALEPSIDAQTMEIHYSKHHAAYVGNLNKAVAGTGYAQMSLEDILLRAGSAGDAIRNNAGGHYNHSLFWNILSAQSSYDEKSELAQAITHSFGSLDSLKVLINRAASTRFGSGWAWLYVTPDKKLAVSSTPNQDNPLMDVTKERGIPILGIDVWEHAYYLKYQNKRGDYLAAIWKVINWQAVNTNYGEALRNPLLKTLEMATWNELEEFHKVMAQTFHPSEEGNLEPVRNRSVELLEKARLLQKSTIPTSFNTPAIKKSIADIVSDASSLNIAVLSGEEDEVIVEKIARLHTTFHRVQELCNH